MTSPRTPNDDRDFRQLTGAFDRPIAPSPNFAEALKQRMNEEETMMQQSPAIPGPPISQRTAKAVAAPPLTRRKWMDIALAAVLIVGMLGGSFWYGRVRIGSDGPSDPQATHYAAQPLSSLSTPEEEGTEGEQAASGSFDPEANLDVVRLGNEGPSNPKFAVLSKDIMVVSGDFPEVMSLSGSGLTAIDMTTGTPVWSREILPLQEFVVSEGHIVGIFTEAPVTEYALMSISVETGKIEWTGPVIANDGGLSVVSPAVSMNAFRPLVIGGMLYYTDGDGVITAHNAATGEVLWTHALELEATESGMGGSGSLVGDGDALYAVDGHNAIRKLDLLTGEQIDRFPLTERPANAFVIRLHLSDDTLFAISMTNVAEGSTSFVDAVDPSDGRILWSERTGLAGLPATYGDVFAITHSLSVGEIEATNSDIETTGIYASFLDTLTGEPIARYGPADGGYATVSWSGDVACINEALAIHCADFAQDDPEFIELPYAPGGESFSPLLFWNDTAIAVSERDGVVLLQPTESQPQQAQTAGEVEARGGGIGSPDRSLLHPGLEPIDGPLSLAWEQIISDPIWILPYGDVVATLGSSELAVHDAATGDVLWSQPTSEAFRNKTYDTDRDPSLLLGRRQGTPVALPWISGDTIYYAGTTDLIGVDLHTGEEVFRTVHTVIDDTTDFSTFSFPWDMVVRDGTAYILTVPSVGQHVMKAIDLESRDELWSYEAGEPVDDWSLASVQLYQPVVTDELVVLNVLRPDNRSIIALNTLNGSVEWEQTYATGVSSNLVNISGIDDRYLVLFQRDTSSDEQDGQPVTNNKSTITLYDLGSGTSIWTSGSDAVDWPDNLGTATCSLVAGSTETALYIACTDDKEVVTIGLDIADGSVFYTDRTATTAPVYLMFQDENRNIYYGGDYTLRRFDTSTREMNEIQITDGSACLASSASNQVLVCHTDNDLGTKGIEVYTAVGLQAPSTPPAPPISEQSTPNPQVIASPATLEELEKLDVARVSPQTAVISGDTLVISGQILESIGSDTLAYGTQAIDLVSGEEQWFVDTGLTGDIAVDNANVYGFEREPTTLFSRGNLVAFSLATGNLEWRTYAQPSAEVNAYLFSERLLKVESNLYIPFENGSVNAYDLSGNLIWSYNSDLPFQEHWIPITNPLVGDEDFIYVSDRTGTIRKLDRLTGDLVDTFAVVDDAETESWIDLNLQADTLIAVIHPPAPLTPDTPESVIVMSAETGQILWTQEINYQTGNTLVTEDLIAVPQYVIDEDSTGQKIVFYDLATGEPRHEVEIESTASPVLSASGDLVCLHTSHVECGSPGNLQRIPTMGVALPNNAGQNPPVMYWNGRLVIANTITGVYVTSAIDAPAMTTLEQDVQSSLLTNDPGHTNAYPAGYDPEVTGEIEKLETLQVQPTTAVISGDTLIVSGRIEETWREERQLRFATQAIDLVTGEERWTAYTGLIGPVVVDEGAVYGYASDSRYWRPSGKLVSLSLETGETEWMVEPLAGMPNGNATPFNDLLMIGTLLYVPFPNGSVIAYDQMGRIKWAYETGRPLPEQFELGWQPIAGDENAIYIAGPDGEITKLDRLTGEVVTTFTIATEEQGEGAWMDLHVRGEKLIALVHPMDGPNRFEQKVSMIVLSSNGSEMYWEQQIDYRTTPLMITDTIVGVPHYEFGQMAPEQQITFYDLNTGEVLGGVDQRATTTPMLSASGEIVCLYSTQVECGIIGSLDLVVDDVVFSNSTSTPHQNPPVVYWNGQLVIVDGATGVYVTRP